MTAALCCWCQRALVQLEGAWFCPNGDCMDRQLASAVEAKDGKSKTRRLLYVPTPKQADFTQHPAKYILFGGAAGPGKSHAARWALYRKCLKIRHFEALLLRETFPELERTHLRRMAAEAPLLGAEFIESKRLMKFPQTGSLIECGHMDDDTAVRKYLSSEYDCIVPEEGSAYPPEPLLELFTRARTSKPQVLADGGAKVWVVSNPGGRAAMLLLDFFIDHSPDFEKYPALVDEYDPNEWVYIPASLDDNPYIDQGYRRQLAVLPKWRYEQLRHGDWRVFSGQFFAQWNERKHVVDLELAKSLDWYEAVDWGYVAPGCVGWIAALPDGHYHVAAEWKYHGLTAEELATGIKKKRKELGLKESQIRYMVGDPSMWQKTGHGRGETYAETLMRRGIRMRKGDNDRRQGWVRVQTLLRDDPNGQPWLTVSPNCPYLKRTIPAMVSDKTDPEDVDTTGDDHGCDMLRYFAQSRPSPTQFVEKKDLIPGSLPWHRQQHERASKGTGVLA